MKFLFTFLLLVISHPGKSEDLQLHPFSTDYCTFYPEGTPSNPTIWKHCCLIHDMTLWAGGVATERHEADLELKRCVAATGQRVQSKLIYFGIRAGNYSPIKFPNMVWNNGWRERPMFQALTAQDIDQIESKLFSSYDYISNDIKTDFILMLRNRL